MARLKEMYVKEVAPALMKKFSYKSTMQIPKLDKIVVNVGAKIPRRSTPSARIWRRSPVKSPLFATQESLLRTSSSERAWPSA